ncbi:MAG: Fic family protein [Propionibacteriales bacterium]|nr:Fic family protein [Propionibacteriales bacterium]
MSDTERTTDWPPHGHEVRSWQQRVAQGPREARRLREVTVSLPPKIRDLTFTADRPLAAMANASAGDLSNLDLVHGRTLAALNHMLLRTEAVASSKIENLEADLTDYGRAVIGVRANATGVAVASATAAIGRMITDTDTHRRIRPEALLTAHQELFRRNPDEQERAGKFRTVQNWISGSDYAPIGALYVPPPPGTVAEYLEDLFAFANRTDLPAVVQAAIVHAQFESIHPFVDGNGRIGRALIHSVLRHRRTTRHLTAPIASALVGHRQRYFDALEDYRNGTASTLIAMLSSATHLATAESWRAAENLQAIRARWQDSPVATAPGTPLYRLLDAVTEHPFVTVPAVVDLLGIDETTARESIDRLEGAAVLSRLSRTRRTPVWIARDVLDEIRDLDVRIHENGLQNPGQVERRSTNSA